jgi:hypothetical protein
MSKRTLVIVIVLLALGLGLGHLSTPSLAQGAGDACLLGDDVAFNIVAQVASVYDSGNVLGGAISVGDTIVGQYTYLSTTPDTNSLPTIGSYWHSSPPYGITLTAGEYTFQTDPGDVNFYFEIANGHTGFDGYMLRSYNNLPPSDGVWVQTISWQLDDPTTTALSSDALPTVAPDLSAWQSAGLVISGYDYDEDQFFIQAHVTSIVCAYSSPEPAEAIQALIDEVLALVDSGALKQGQANGLIQPLKNAIRSLGRDKLNPACSLLHGFVGKLERKVDDGALTAEEAQPLFDAIDEIITDLGCP